MNQRRLVFSKPGAEFPAYPAAELEMITLPGSFKS
jgi:hypothetical protein